MSWTTWVSRGRSLGQAVKNVQRLRQILGVMAKYGFVDVVERIGLTRMLPSRLAAYAQAQSEKPPQERLRMAFEDLGPTFVKLGQLLSTRPDLLPQAYIDEFTRLQDNVQPLSFAVVQRVIEAELKRPLLEAFREVESQPLAAASIGQVHGATLHTGERVVIKVQRPEIEAVIRNDIALLEFLAALLEKYVPETRVVRPKVVVKEFFRTLETELDFIVEGGNMTQISRNLSEFDGILIPRVFSSVSSRRVLTMDRLEGIKLNDIQAIDAAGIDRKAIVEMGARAFLKSVMQDGVFHGDLHAGNLFVLPGSRLGIIDFGIVGRLSEQSRSQLAAMTIALIQQDYEHLCYLYAELGAAEASVDLMGFQREVQNTFSPYIGLPLGQLNMGKLLIEATRIATQFQIKVPSEWMIVFKAILTIEGMGRTLDPGFDLMGMGQVMIGDLIRAQVNPSRLARDSAWLARDLASLLKVLPRQLKWMLRKFNSNDFAVEIQVRELSQITQQIDTHGRRLSSSLISVGFLITGAMTLGTPSGPMLGDTPAISVLFFALGLLNWIIDGLRLR